MAIVTKIEAQDRPYYTLNDKLSSNIKADTAQISQQITHAHLILDYNPDSATLLFKEAIVKSAAIGYGDGIIRSLRNLGLIYNVQGYYEKSLQCFKLALPYAEKIHNNQSAIAQIYIGITVYYIHVGAFDSAAHYIYKALDEIEYVKTTNFDVIFIYNDIAEFWIMMGDTKKALFYSRKAKDLAIKYSDTSNIVMSMVSEADIYANNKQWDSAMFYCQQTIAWCKRANNFNQRASFLCEATLGTGVIYIGMNQPKKAIPWLQEAVTLSKQVRNQTKLINSYYNLGYAYYMLYDYKKAAEILQMVCLQSQNIGLKNEEVANAHSFLAEIYKQNRNYIKALSELETYHQIRDSLLTKEKTQAANQLDVKYRVAEKDKALAEKQLQIIKQQSYLKEKNFWIVGISTGALLLAVLFVSLYRSRQHKEKIDKLNAVLLGEENERTRIARELHDGIGGMLAAIKMNFGALQKKHTTLSQSDDFSDTFYMLNEACSEVRKTAHNLMPDILMRHGLAEAVKLYIEKINHGDNLQVDLQINGDIESFNKSFKLSIYRIIQELVQNIVRHSGANNALVQIIKKEEVLSILIEDNGSGFNSTSPDEGMGLQNVQFRVEALNGDFSIQSTAMKGTLVYIKFYLQKLKNIQVYENSSDHS